MYLKLLKNFDWILFAVIVLLVALGVSLVYSTTLDIRLHTSLAYKQIIFALVGIGAIFIMGFLIPYGVIGSYIWILYGGANIFLGTVLLWGETIRGTTGWLALGPVQFQPSELAKIILIITLAWYFSRRLKEIIRFRHIVTSGILTLIPAGLVLLEPDLGTALLFVILWFGMLLVSGARRLYILLTLGLGTLVSIGSWFFLLEPYQKARLATFVNPHLDPLGRGYNILQSIIAIGSGGVLGKGLGQGTQSQLQFLPAQHTDFIFAVMAEELGFVGVLFVLGLFLVLFLRLIRTAKLSKDNFGILLVLGAGILIFIEVMINIGMNIGILPVTGIPLPLVSYGGSALITTLLALGIVESVAVRRKQTLF